MKGAVLCALGILGCAASSFAQSLLSVSLFQSISNQSVRLSWPASASGFVLEETDALGGASVWQSVAQTPSLQDNQLSVTVSATGKSRYFRLRQTQMPVLGFQITGHTPLDGANEVGV